MTMTASSSNNSMKDRQDRSMKLTRSGMARSQSMKCVNNGLRQWDMSAGASKPLRWYPSHLSPENQLGLSKSASNFQSLETIGEDMHAQGRLHELRINNRMNIMLGNHDDRFSRRISEESNTFISAPRRHSDSDILDHPSPSRYNKRRHQAHNRNKRSSNPEIKQSDRPRNSRRKSYVGVDYDTFSDRSDANSQKSSKSRLSVCSDDSLSSASKLAARRRHAADGLLAVNISKESSLVSLVQQEARGNQRSVNQAVNRTDTVSSAVVNIDVLKAQPKRHMSAFSAEGEGPSPFSTLEIPVEFLDISTSRVRKMIAPVVVSLIAMTLLACLTAAVYFAVVLKDSQARQIELLQVTLKFSLAREQQVWDIHRLTSSELSELTVAYCQQVDGIYKTSTFTSNYRGCEVETLTNEKIQFMLYFLDGSVPEQQREDNIVEVLKLRSQPAGVEGSQLRKISDITFDISNQTRSVQVQKIRKSETFHISSGSASIDASFSTGASSSLVKIKAFSKDDGLTTSVTTMMSTSTTATSGATTTTTSTTATSGATTTTTSTTATSGATTTTTSYNTTATTITSRPVHSYNDEDNTVVIDTICSTLDPTEIIAHPFDCTHYIQCEFMKPVIRPCSGNLVFNPTVKTCVKPTPDLPCSSLQPCDNINGGYFAHPTNCRSYITCDLGRTVIQSCKNNFTWDDVSKTCVVTRNEREC